VEYNQLGKTGLKVSRLGAGISEIGFNLTLDNEKQASDVLNAALDQGHSGRQGRRQNQIHRIRRRQ